jgi:hypothetical protein
VGKKDFLIDLNNPTLVRARAGCAQNAPDDAP